MKRLWSTLACLGVMRVYITGAEKVEKVYFASHALKPERFYPELIHGRHLPCLALSLRPLELNLGCHQVALVVACHCSVVPYLQSKNMLDCHLDASLNSDLFWPAFHCAALQ